MLGLLRRLPKAKAVESYLELLNLEPLRPRVHDSWHAVKDRECKGYATACHDRTKGSIQTRITTKDQSWIERSIVNCHKARSSLGRESRWHGIAQVNEGWDLAALSGS